MQRRHNHGRRHRPQQFHEEEENEPVSQCTEIHRQQKSKHFLTQHQILFLFLSLFQPLLHSLLQFMPILLLVGLSLMSSFMLQDPPYSLSRTG